VRDRCERLEDVDVVTADLLHGVIASLEEQLWMIRVQAG
jgi:starvation-inducible DNA-binding protein